MASEKNWNGSGSNPNGSSMRWSAKFQSAVCTSAGDRYPPDASSDDSACSRKPTVTIVRFWPILLKKSASVSTAEKFAPEIEICALGRRFTTRISSSSTQKRCFYPSVFERFGQTDFFNRIGRKRTWLTR